MLILQNIHQIDVRAFHWCLHFRYRDVLVALSRAFSRSADGYLYVVLGIALLWLAHYQSVLILICGFAVERAIYFSCKSTFKRNRPPAAIPGYRSVIEPSDQFSFPSGHTSGAFFVAGFLTLLFPSLFLLWYFWAASVGAARVFLGVHFPTDILAGAVIGTAVIQGSLYFFTANPF